LGSSISGIEPLYDAVTLRIGTFTTTIPPLSFTKTGPGSYSFVGLINSVLLQASINLTGGNTYTFQASANVNLTGKLKPATVTLTIVCAQLITMKVPCSYVSDAAFACCLQQ
jgi:hypothetical protein